MRCLLLATICCLARFAPAQQPGCAFVESREILGKDLAAAFAAFDPLPKDLQLGMMPLPGSIRTFHAPELLSLAERYSIHLDQAREVCFEWPMEPLDRGKTLTAMRDALGGVDVQIELVEVSVYQTPRGTVEFPRASLGRPASPDQRTPVLWRGAVVYGGGLRYAVWARVRIIADCTRLVAAENLKPGVPISASQVHAETAKLFPDSDRCTLSLAKVVGLAPSRPVPAGAEIRASLLAPPYDVTRGEDVEVEVNSGGARLALAGKAESNGRTGDLVAIRNPSSNRIFRARVNGKSHAIVVADSPGGY